MERNISFSVPWVLFRLQKSLFGVSVSSVREMLAVPKIVPVPKTPSHIRGVADLRDNVTTIMDLRVRLGMIPLKKEIDDLVDLMKQREQDHRKWLKELESSVRQQREFKLATDPHKCAFGKWYDTFTTDNLTLGHALKKFDQPHKRIHAIAEKVRGLADKGDFNGAYTIIESVRQNELSEMIKLFAETCLILNTSYREIIIVLELIDKCMGISVDSVEAVEVLSETCTEDISGIACARNDNCIAGICKRAKSKEVIQLIDIEKL